MKALTVAAMLISSGCGEAYLLVEDIDGAIAVGPQQRILASKVVQPSCLCVSQSSIVEIDPETGESEVVAPFAGNGGAIVRAEDGTVFWTDSGFDDVGHWTVQALAPGGEPRTLSTITTTLAGAGGPIALDRGFVWWIEERTRLERVPVGGGPIEVMATAPKIYGLAIAGERVFWSTSSAVFALDPATGVSSTVAAGLNGVAYLTQHGGDLFWITWVEDGFAIQRVRAAGGEPTEMIRQPDPNPEGLSGLLAGPALAVDDTHVYWSSSLAGQTGTGRIVRMALDSGAPEMFLDHLDSVPLQLAIGETRVFWTSFGLFAAPK